MTVTLASLIALVNGELENRSNRGSATAEGDPVATTYLLTPTNRTILSNATFACYIDGTLSTAGDMDYVSGVWTFDDPQPAKALLWEFDYVYWPDTLVSDAVKAGVAALFPHFYNTLAAVKANTGSTEYDVGTVNTHCVRQIETSTTGAAPWALLRRSKYEVIPSPDDLSVRFYTAPSGSLRVHTIERFGFIPASITEPIVAADCFAIPERAIGAVVSYACYYLLTQKMAPRMRIDTAVTTTGAGNLSPRQMNDASNAFYLRFQMQMATTKMRPWSGG